MPRLFHVLVACLCTSFISCSFAQAPSFKLQVLPIFQKNCAIATCHESQTKMAGYIFTNYNAITEKGIAPFKPEKSHVYRVLQPNAAKPMPPKPYAALKSEEIELIRQWILAGAKNN